MAAPVRRRTRARELALQFLYTLELRGHEAHEEREAFIDHHTRRGQDARGQAEIAQYARTLIQGVDQHREELNRWIEHIARNWRLERMAHVDRNILRMAIFELLYQPDIPFKVVINEAIDIAKRYSTGQSGSFVNGILDRARILIQEGRERTGLEAPPPPDAAPAPAPAGDPVPGDRDIRLDPAPMPRPREGAPRLPFRRRPSPPTSGSEA